MKKKNENKIDMLPSKILEDKNISDECLGFFYRLIVKTGFGKGKFPEEKQYLLDELIKNGYAKMIDDSIIIKV